MQERNRPIKSLNLTISSEAKERAHLLWARREHKRGRRGKTTRLLVQVSRETFPLAERSSYPMDEEGAIFLEVSDR